MNVGFQRLGPGHQVVPERNWSARDSETTYLVVVNDLRSDQARDVSFRLQRSLSNTLRGHYRTLQPFIARSLRPTQRPITRPWTLEIFDANVGEVQLSGRLLERSRSELLVVLHGLGGSVDSGYMAEALRAADTRGISCLLLNCRGADRSGGDIYHSGLSGDIHAVLQSPELAGFEVIDLLGYSLGGHIALHYACAADAQAVDARVRRVAAICSPLDLARSADDFDAARFSVYRSHVMDGLKEIYTAAYQRRPHGVLPLEARKIQKIRAWDHTIVAPRFGFQSADHYYATQSVGPLLGQLRRQALYVGATHDPMVRADAVVPHLANSQVEVVWDDTAGHLGFGPNFDLGRPGPLGLESQVLSWLAR